MERPKISVIIPLYNTQNYIKETLYSIINQSVKEIEIIIINDGSTDNSVGIVNEVSDSRIILLSQTNQGQGAARNRGLETATGKYIYFMDSDDLLTPDALEKCYEKCEKKNLDFVFFNADIFNDTYHQFPTNNYQRTLSDEKVYNGIEATNKLMEKYQFKAPVWINFIRKSYLDHINLRFLPSVAHEDEHFTTLLFLQAKQIGFIKESLFKRRVRSNSTMTSALKYRNIECYFIITDEIEKFAAGKESNLQKTVNLFLSRMLNSALYNARKLPLKDKLKIVQLSRKKLKYIKIKQLITLFLKK